MSLSDEGLALQALLHQFWDGRGIDVVTGTELMWFEGKFITQAAYDALCADEDNQIARAEGSM